MEIDHQIFFHKDPCKHTRAIAVNARARDKTRTRTFTAFARVCVHGSLWKKIGGKFLSYELKFQISLRSELSLRRYSTFSNHV